MPLPVALATLVGTGAIIIPLARRVLLGVGFGLVAYIGIGALWDSIQSNIASYLGGVSSSILTILGIARVDDAIQVVLSAGSAKLALRGLNAAGSLIMPRWRWID